MVDRIRLDADALGKIVYDALDKIHRLKRRLYPIDLHAGSCAAGQRDDVETHVKTVPCGGFMHIYLAGFPDPVSLSVVYGLGRMHESIGFSRH